MGGVVLVTGATGFIGRHLCDRLVREGHRVRGLARPGSGPLVAGVEPAPAADLTDRPAIRSALEGVGAVVHLAARVHVMRDRSADPLAAFRRVNVEGTRILLEEAAAAGSARLAFISSVKAMGTGGDAVWSESTPAAPRDPYGRSKLEAERVVREMAAAVGLHAPILRLPLVYGPEMRGNLLRLFALVDRGIPVPFGRVRNRRSLAYVGNVVEAVLAVLAVPAAARETFLVSDGEDLSTPELIHAIGRALGRPARLVPVPGAALRAAGRAGDAGARLLGRFPVTSAEIDRLTGSLVVDATRLRNVAGFRPPYAVADGLRATAEWYRAGRSERGPMGSDAG